MRSKISFFLISFFLSFILFYNQVKAEDDNCLMDTVPPIITNTHDYHYEIGQPYPDYSLDVVVTDTCDYVLQISDDLIDYTQEGTYPLYYYAGDSSGNSSTIIVFVYVHEDIRPPVFNQIINRHIEFQQALTEDFFLEGVSATDHFDGDLTDSILVDYSSVNVLILGVYPVTYTIIDTHDNISIETITVTVEDTTPPLISGQKNYTVEVFTDNINYSEEVSAVDLYDGAVGILMDDSQVNLNEVGSYEVILAATDTNGNSTNEVILVTVVDTTVPLISGQKDYTVEVFTDNINYLEDVSAIDLYDGEVDILIDDSQVSLDEVGSYEVILSAVDANGNSTNEAILVTVVDTTAPVIAGYKNYTIEVFTESIPYLEDACAIDLYDGAVEIIVDDSQVNLNVLGTYEVNLIARDAHLNETQVVLTVTVVDTTPPEMSGYKDYRVEVFTPLIDYLDGVTAIDLYDGVMTIVLDDSNVDLTVFGQYEVTLTAKDSNGNSTMSLIQVIVEDTTSPIFTSYQALFTHEIGSSIPNYLSSVVVEDNYDGLINNENILIYDQYINYHVDGVYPLIYVVTDVSGNSNSQTVYVKIFDSHPPTISAPDEFIISLTSSNINFLEGVTALDNISGDLTEFIIVDDSAIIYDQMGVYPIKFIVTDLSGNTAVIIRNVTVNEDLEAPEISGTVTYTVEIGSEEINYLDNLVIKDNFTQDLIINIDDSQVNLNLVGTYPVYVTTRDNNQNSTTIEITVNLIDTTPPVMSGYQNYTVEVLIPNIDYLDGVTARDLNDGLVTIEIDDSQVNLNEVGTYEVILSAIDTSGNDISEVITVTVVDTTPPIFNLINNKTVEVHTESVDYLAGVTVTDNLDESLNVIVDSSFVDLNTIGSYQVTLIVSDVSLNNAIKYYQINVVDTIKPEITGYHDVRITQNETFNPLDGISVTDNYDSDLLENVVVIGNYDVKKSGVYKLELKVSDDSSNTTTVKFDLVVENAYQKEIVFGSIVGVGLIGIGVLVWFKRKR